jgi:hypothetical protein
MTDRELLQQALDALISVWNMDKTKKQVETIQAIKARLAQPEPEELGEIIPADEKQLKRIANLVKPEKEWVGLTDEEILEEYRQSYGDDGNLTDVYFARAIEAKLKEKNSG